MTSIQVRLRSDQPDRGADLLLDWFDDKQSSTIAYDPRFLRDLAISPTARDLLRVGGVVFVADKIVLRKTASDAWTRDIAVAVPVTDPDLWSAAAPALNRTLRFLTGDRWAFTFEPFPPARKDDGDGRRRRRRRAQMTLPIDTFDAVCLFSGGLDSLAGAVDLLEAARKPVFVGHHESGKPNKLQRDLFAALQTEYPGGTCDLRRLYLAARGRTAAQRRSLPRARERTTRSRSFLFLAAAAAIADAIGPETPIVMPENGFIGINVPLTPARAGSLSTRTTHPQYVAYVTDLFAQLGVDHAIENPFRLKTKGEILALSANPAGLQRLAPKSVSCSHPEAGRWAGGPAAAEQGNCGVCFPCLIRGASMHHVGWADGYRHMDPLDPQIRDALLDPSKQTGASVRAVRDNLRRDTRPVDVLLNGSIPNGEGLAFYDVYLRGRGELRRSLSTGPSPLV